MEVRGDVHVLTHVNARSHWIEQWMCLVRANIHASMIWVLERAKKVHALDRTATVIAIYIAIPVTSGLEN
jgi:hypothetical protein